MQLMQSNKDYTGTVQHKHASVIPDATERNGPCAVQQAHDILLPV